MSLFQILEQVSTELSHEVMVNASNWSQVHNGFHQELTKHIQWVLNNSSSERLYRDKEALDGITGIIKKYTGISVVVSQLYTVFAMLPPDLNKNHVLIKTFTKVFYKNREVRKTEEGLKGTVDIKNFKVSGDFSDIEVKLFLDPGLMFEGYLTAAQISAIILHEVGHMFSYFALCADIVSVNLPMITLINQLTNTEQEDEIEIILKKWNDREETLTKVDVEELKGKNKVVIATALVTNHIQDNRSSTNHIEYDGVNAEFLADNFTARLGAGADVAAGLDVIYSTHGHRNRSMVIFVCNEVINTVTLLIWTAFTAVTLPTVIGPIVGILFILAVLNTSSNQTDGTYDVIKRRYQRIREDNIVMLKDKNIDKAIGERIRNDIKRIDDILKKYNDFKSPIGRIADIILPTLRRRKSQSEFYKELEQLSANELFIAAYDLRNL